MSENRVENPIRLFRSDNSEVLKQDFDAVILGGGLAGLSAAAKLVSKGLKPLVVERNYLPGGCASSYYRNGYVFESGATTLIGLDVGLPLHDLLLETGIELRPIKLEIPMQIHLQDGRTITRFSDPNAWKNEAKRVFGEAGQDRFWDICSDISNFVWSVAKRFRRFPPQSPADWIACIKALKFSDLKMAPYAFQTVEDFLKKHQLHQNVAFRKFVDEQLMITAQSRSHEVPMLYGAAALCYPQMGNYYLQGGLVRLSEALCSYIQTGGGKILLRTAVNAIEQEKSGFTVHLDEAKIHCARLISSLPLNNLQTLFSPEATIQNKFKSMVRPLDELHSAFQLSLVVRDKPLDCIHQQVHMPWGGSVFLSYSHANDRLRSPEGTRVLSITTHTQTIGETASSKQTWEENVLKELFKRQLLDPVDLIYRHSSGPEAWQSWTGRLAGFVGGYPQNMEVLPWRQTGHKLLKGLYLCGDSVYPGQGIPAVVLSGSLAAERLISDH